MTPTLPKRRWTKSVREVQTGSFTVDCLILRPAEDLGLREGLGLGPRSEVTKWRMTRSSSSDGFIEMVVNTGDLSRVAEFIAPAIAEETARHIEGVRSTYPDLSVTVGDQIAECEMVVARVAAKGTHTGPYLGLTPTNKPILIEGVNIDRIRSGKIIEHWGAANTLEALVSINAFRLVQIS